MPRAAVPVTLDDEGDGPAGVGRRLRDCARRRRARRIVGEELRRGGRVAVQELDLRGRVALGVDRVAERRVRDVRVAEEGRDLRAREDGSSDRVVPDPDSPPDPALGSRDENVAANGEARDKALVPPVLAYGERARDIRSVERHPHVVRRGVSELDPDEGVASGDQVGSVRKHGDRADLRDRSLLRRSLAPHGERRSSDKRGQEARASRQQPQFHVSSFGGTRRRLRSPSPAGLTAPVTGAISDYLILLNRLCTAERVR
jgi:hypothetical protein